MKIIYECKVKAQGDCAEEFRETNMFVIFGDNAPPEIKDYCYWIDLAPINGTIAAGQYLRVDGRSYLILSAAGIFPST